MKPILILIAIAALFYGIWHINNPYPSPLNWDIWEHQTVINAIRGGAFALLPSQLSDTFRFDGYTTLFHVLIAGIQSILHIQNIPGFWWIAEGIFFVLTTLATYAFVYAITKNRLAAFAGGILSAGFFESAVAFTTLFLLPQTVAALIWVVGMTVVVTQKTKQKKLLAAFITTLVILPFHAIVGTLGAVYLFIMAIEPKLNWLLVLIASYAIPTYLATHFGLAGLNAGEAQYFNQTLPEKLTLFRQWYGYLPIPFLLLGLWKGNRTLTVMLVASVGLLASPFPYVLKFVVIIRYIMIAVMAIGIGEYLQLLTSKTARYFGLGVLTAVTLLIFVTNTTVWKNPVVFRGIASHVSADEQEAARILKGRYGNNPHAFLISDPATQYILEPLTGINAQGGAYMTTESRQALLDALQSDTVEGFVRTLSRIQDGLHPKQQRAILFAVTSRTFTWMEQDTNTKLSIAYNVWRANALSLDNNLMIQQWQHRFHLQEVYRNSSIVVFEIGATI
jgi:hypothetical protein